MKYTTHTRPDDGLKHWIIATLLEKDASSLAIVRMRVGYVYWESFLYPGIYILGVYKWEKSTVQSKLCAKNYTDRNG